MDPKTAKKLVKKLRTKHDEGAWEAKDILRAAHLPTLPPDDPDVARVLDKAVKGTPVSPILLVVDVKKNWCIVADGWHRTSAQHWLDENGMIPCHFITWEG
jgi:hypothetical protein